MNHSRITRRSFARSMMLASVGLRALRASGGPLASSHTKTPGETPVSLQLYTVRTLTEKDFAGTLAKVAQIGYDAVELGGFGGLSSKEIKKLLKDLGLQCSGSHEPFERLQGALPQVIQDNQEIGNSYVICPYMPESFQARGLDGFKEFGHKLTEVGAALKNANLQLCYHNHDFEFKAVGGKYLLDYLFAEVDPGLLKAEVDVFWVLHGGEDPIAHLRKYFGRVPLLHIKDMTKDDRRTFAPVSTGRLDLAEIVKAARAGGAVWFVIEQDETEQPVLEAIAISLRNFRRILNA